MRPKQRSANLSAGQIFYELTLVKFSTNSSTGRIFCGKNQPSAGPPVNAMMHYCIPIQQSVPHSTIEVILGMSCYTHRQTTLWVWGRVTSVISHGNWSLTFTVLCSRWSRWPWQCATTLEDTTEITILSGKFLCKMEIDLMIPRKVPWGRKNKQKRSWGVGRDGGTTICFKRG